MGAKLEFHSGTTILWDDTHRLNLAGHMGKAFYQVTDKGTLTQTDKF